MGTAQEPCQNENTSSKAPRARLKGRARKKAQQRESSSLSHAPTFCLRLVSFTELSHIIVNDKRLSLLQPLVNPVQHRVKLRRKHSSIFASSESDSSLCESNATHNYFVETLEGVLDILKSKHASSCTGFEISRTTKPDKGSQPGEQICCPSSP